MPKLKRCIAGFCPLCHSAFPARLCYAFFSYFMLKPAMPSSILKNWRNEITPISVAAIFILLLAILIQIVFLVDYRNNVLDDARSGMKSTVKTLETQTRAMLRDVDLTYRVLESQLQPSDLNVQPGQGNPEINEQIRNIKRALPEISVLGITNAAGFYTYHSADDLPGHVSLADREYFKQQHAGEAPGHTTVEFLYGKTSKVWTVIISRRLTLPDGSFAGVMVSGLNLDSLQGFIESLYLPGGAVMSIRDNQNRVVVHHPHDVVARGTPVTPALFEGQLERGEHEGYGRGHTAFGHDVAIGAFVAPDDLPFRFMAAVPESTLLASWYRIVLLALLGTVVLATAFFALLREAHLARARERTIREQEGRLRLAASVFDHAAEGILIADPTGKILSVNESTEIITGYAAEDLIGNPLSLLNSKFQDVGRCSMVQRLLADGQPWTGDIWNARKNGDVYAQYTSAVPVISEAGQVTHFVYLIMDVTDDRRAQDRLSRLAFHDALTGLPNRRMFFGELDRAIRSAPLRKSQLMACYLDLDGFKQVNDQYGHAAGDELLRVISRRLTGALRTTDTVARLGGDEFAFFAWVGDSASNDSVEMVIGRVLEAIAKPCELSRDGAAHIMAQVSGSIGVALYPEHGESAEILIRRADQAMYAAKQAGKNRFCVGAGGG